MAFHSFPVFQLVAQGKVFSDWIRTTTEVNSPSIPVLNIMKTETLSTVSGLYYAIIEKVFNVFCEVPVPILRCMGLTSGWATVLSKSLNL